MLEKLESESRVEGPVDGPTIARVVLAGTVTGFVVVAGLVAAAALSAGSSVAAAIGLGVFAGLWGGPGFGAMLAFSVHEGRRQH